MKTPTNFLLLLVSGLLLFSACQRQKKVPLTLAPFYQTPAGAVEAALRQMSTEQKISQLILVRVRNETQLQTAALAAQAGMIGGVLPENIPLQRWIAYAAALRNTSKYPLLIGATTGGLFNNQLSDAVPFPNEYTLRATASPTLSRQLAAIRLRQAELLGINFCIGPTIYPAAVWHPGTQLPYPQYALPDYDTRSWHQAGILQLGNSLYHHTIPARDSTGQQSKPYQQLIKGGIPGFWIDTALLIPNAEPNHLRRYLEENLQLDALLAGAGPIERLASAGADLIVWEGHPDEARNILLELLNQRIISPADLDQRVRRILSAKFWTAQTAAPQPAPDSLYYAYFQHEHLAFYAQQVWSQSPVLLYDAPKHIPLPANKPYRIIQLRADSNLSFAHAFREFAQADSIAYQLSAIDSQRINLIFWDSNTSLPDSTHWAQLQASQAIVLIHTGPLNHLRGVDTCHTVLHLPEYNHHTARAAVQLLTGAQGAVAQLPDGLDTTFLPLSGIKTPKTRLKHTQPEEEGIMAEKFVGIDAIALSAIGKKIFPGCQVLVAKNGNIIYSKSFGYLSYTDSIPVSNQTLYDIASITKVAATTLAAMKLTEQQTLQLDKAIRDYLPQVRGEPGKITIRQLLTHTSGLQAYLPTAAYVRAPLKRKETCNAFFCNKERVGYSVPVAAQMYFRDSQYKALIKHLYQLPVRRRKKVHYSDVNMVLLQQLLERQSGMTLDRLVNDYYYYPLGLRRIGWRPYQTYPLREIAPTKKDDQWRKQVLHGYVHDSAAALMGGVAGHAGLFSNAEDLAVIFQLLLNDGQYGDKRYLSANRIRLFTAYDSRARRGLGFDKPRPVKYPSFSGRLPQEGFGHTGFTGTCIWADPEEQLIYIFLSNRVHPTNNNNRFYTDNIRKRIHEVIYDALNTFQPRLPDA